MFDRFAERAILVVMLAQEEARRLNHNFIGTEAILLGIIGEGRSGASKSLKRAGVELGRARIEVETIIGRGPGAPVEIPFTPRAKKVILLACKEANERNEERISCDHLLLGLIREATEDPTNGRDGVAVRVLKTLGVDVQQLGEQVSDLSGES